MLRYIDSDIGNFLPVLRIFFQIGTLRQIRKIIRVLCQIRTDQYPFLSAISRLNKRMLTVRRRVFLHNLIPFGGIPFFALINCLCGSCIISCLRRLQIRRGIRLTLYRIHIPEIQILCPQLLLRCCFCFCFRFRLCVSLLLLLRSILRIFPAVIRFFIVFHDNKQHDKHKNRHAYHHVYH